MPASARARETSTYAQGRVFDAVTKQPLNAVVQLFDLGTNTLTQQVYSDPETGQYTAVLNEGRAYAMYATAPGHLLRSLSFDYSTQQRFDSLTLDIYLDPAKSGRSAVLNNLFFDSNQATIKSRSRTELDRLVEFLRQDPALRVEVAGHTDNVGTPAANQALSQRPRKDERIKITKGRHTEYVRHVRYTATHRYRPWPLSIALISRRYMSLLLILSRTARFLN